VLAGRVASAPGGIGSLPNLVRLGATQRRRGSRRELPLVHGKNAPARGSTGFRGQPGLLPLESRRPATMCLDAILSSAALGFKPGVGRRW
jgi:hypothetical protein